MEGLKKLLSWGKKSKLHLDDDKSEFIPEKKAVPILQPVSDVRGPTKVPYNGKKAKKARKNQRSMHKIAACRPA